MLDPLLLLTRNQRSHRGAVVGRVAEHDPGRPLTHRVHGVVVDPALDEDARSRRTDLALVPEHAVRRPLDRGVEVSIREHDVGGLASELKRDPLQRVGAAAHDELPHLARAGEPDLVHARVGDQGRTGRLAEPRQHVEDARGQPRFLQDLR